MCRFAPEPMPQKTCAGRLAKLANAHVPRSCWRNGCSKPPTTTTTITTTHTSPPPPPPPPPPLGRGSRSARNARAKGCTYVLNTPFELVSHNSNGSVQPGTDAGAGAGTGTYARAQLRPHTTAHAGTGFNRADHCHSARCSSAARQQSVSRPLGRQREGRGGGERAHAETLLHARKRSSDVPRVPRATCGIAQQPCTCRVRAAALGRKRRGERT